MGAKLLIIDDEPGICDLIHKVFSEDGYQVERATSASGGVRKARDFRPHVVLLDLKMRGMDGLAALRRIRRVSRASKVIVLTGYGTRQAAQEAMRFGAYDFTAKPFDLDLVRGLIAEALGP